MHSLSSEAEAYSVAQAGYELRVTSLPNVCERRACSRKPHLGQCENSNITIFSNASILNMVA